MANAWAGEVEVTLDGVPHVARLTLGALAELEASLGTGSLVDLAERFESGRYAARDVLGLIVAGLRGGGWHGTAADLSCFRRRDLAQDARILRDSPEGQSFRRASR